MKLLQLYDRFYSSNVTYKIGMKRRHSQSQIYDLFIIIRLSDEQRTEIAANVWRSKANNERQKNCFSERRIAI